MCIRYLVLLFLSVFFKFLFADTMDHYMNIVNQIPKMEMKADSNSQAWARSARNILTITNESIAETLIQANNLARQQKMQLFCLPFGTELNANTLGGIIQQTYTELLSQKNDKDKMTISQVAWLGITKRYPCQNTNLAMKQLSSVLLATHRTLHNK